MTTDRELLELAASAAGIRLHVWGTKGAENFADLDARAGEGRWNPLTDDGDALRLAVKLDLTLQPGTVWSCLNGASVRFDYEYRTVDSMESLRRAIVRAAAAIGAKS